MRNTTFEIVKMFLGSPQLAFKMYQIPMEHTVYDSLKMGKINKGTLNSIKITETYPERSAEQGTFGGSLKI